MESLKSLLDIQRVLPNSDIEKELESLAKSLMNDYCISNGKHTYRLLEIEFYIYDKDAHADEHVYERDAEAGQLLLHKMGIDICFASSMSKGQFGGILIRALERDDRKYFGGPRICSYELMNTATSLCSVEASQDKLNFDVERSIRIGINEWKDSKSDWKDEYYNKKYRFTRKGLERIQMDVCRYDFRETAIKNEIKTYKL